jgi:hypothetical protein
VEDRVDRVRDQGEGVLRGEEPNKGHGCSKLACDWEIEEKLSSF